MSKPNAYQRNITLNYVFEFFKYSNVMHAFWMVYLIQLGYTLFEVGLLESIFHVVSFVMETPTGILADRFGRHRSRQLGIVLHMAYLVFLWQGSSFLVVAIGFALAALSFNLESGSATAFVYDTLKHLQQSNQFPVIEARRETIIRIASVVGSIAGGFLIALGYAWAFWVNLIAYGFILCVSVWLKETTLQHEEDEKPTLIIHLKRMKEGLKKHPILLVWMGYFGWISMTFAIVGYYVTTYWQELGWSESTMGMLLAIAGLAAALGAWVAPKIQNKLSLLKGLNIASIATMMGLLIIPLAWATPIVVIVLSMLDGWLYVHIHAVMNEKIESSVRASMLSLNAMMYSVLMMLGFPLFGWIVELTSYSIGFWSLSGVFMTVLIFVWGSNFLFRRRTFTS
jgi:MFS family permease